MARWAVLMIVAWARVLVTFSVASVVSGFWRAFACFKNLDIFAWDLISALLLESFDCSNDLFGSNKRRHSQLPLC